MWAFSWANGNVCFLYTGCKSDSPYTRKSNCSVTATFIWHWSVLSLHPIKQTRTPLLFSTSWYCLLTYWLFQVWHVTSWSTYTPSRNFLLSKYIKAQIKGQLQILASSRVERLKNLSSYHYVEHFPSSSFQRTITAFKKT